MTSEPGTVRGWTIEYRHSVFDEIVTAVATRDGQIITGVGYSQTTAREACLRHLREYEAGADIGWLSRAELARR